jgi:hypothetical protein
MFLARPLLPPTQASSIACASHNQRKTPETATLFSLSHAGHALLDLRQVSTEVYPEAARAWHTLICVTRENGKRILIDNQLLTGQSHAPGAAVRACPETTTLKSTGNRNMKTFIVWSAIVVQIAAWSSSGVAAITPIANPFTGDGLETWEEFTAGQIGSPVTMFSGEATISGGNQFIWQTEYMLGAAGGLGLGPFDARAYDGTQGYVNSIYEGITQITLRSPISDFGGYWGSGVEWGTTPPVLLTFLDSQGSSIGTTSFTYGSPGNNGTLEWQGWHSSLPVYGITYYGNWVASDSLRYTLAPEPSLGALLIMGAVLYTRRKTSLARIQGLSPSQPVP